MSGSLCLSFISQNHNYFHIKSDEYNFLSKLNVEFDAIYNFVIDFLYFRYLRGSNYSFLSDFKIYFFEFFK